MSKEMNFKLALTVMAPATGITRVKPKSHADCSTGDANIGHV